MTAASPARPRRELPKQERINFRGARPPRTREIHEAIAQVRQSGVVPVLQARLNRRADANRRLSILGYETAVTLHGWTRHHRMHLVEVVRLINAFTPSTLRLLGMPDWHYDGCYDRFQRLFTAISRALKHGWHHADPDTNVTTFIDLNWYRQRAGLAPVPLDLIRGCALAIDGTDMETWGRIHGDRSTVELDGEPEPDEDDA
jgi:hypothetical protein